MKKDKQIKPFTFVHNQELWLWSFSCFGSSVFKNTFVFKDLSELFSVIFQINFPSEHLSSWCRLTCNLPESWARPEQFSLTHQPLSPHLHCAFKTTVQSHHHHYHHPPPRHHEECFTLTDPDLRSKRLSSEELIQVQMSPEWNLNPQLFIWSFIWLFTRN